ncbi:hypothetical protein QQG55_45595 [Brugia pahangi]|uniref:Bacterial ubiquitin-like modifier n=1 Tax=Brugia pahangi TaxID=6280 RepID=A0A0N4TJ86_BRUPA|nr:unnamed protein product [Brugia pahangi]
MILLDEVQTRLDELEGRNAQGEMEEDAAPQEPEFDEETESDPLPNDGDGEPEVQVAPMEISELVLRTKTVLAIQEALATATPDEFHLGDFRSSSEGSCKCRR